MFHFTIALITTTFVVNTIINHAVCDDTEEPKESEINKFLNTGLWNQNTILGGFINFKQSFSTLSVNQIDDLFKRPDGETLENMKVRELQKSINIQYFLDHKANHGLDLNNDVKSSNFFCQQQSNTIISEIDIIDTPMTRKKTIELLLGRSVSWTDLYRVCLGYMEKLKVNIFHGGSKLGAFQCLYELWSYDLLTYETLHEEKFPEGDNIKNEHKLFKLYIEYFPLEYFVMYDKVVNKNISHKKMENFRSVYKYCKETGFKYIRNSGILD